MRRVTVALGVLWGLSACKAHFEPLPPRTGGITTRTLQFTSGLRVVVEPDLGSKRVAFALLVGAGSAQDPAGKEGLAHFLEHLAFRSKPADRLSAWDELDFAGLASSGSSHANATTRRDSTTYLGIAPASSAAQVLPLMASLVVQPLRGVDDTTIEVERGVVLAERYTTDPTAGGALADALIQATLPAGARRVEGGEGASLARITRADLEAFRYQHYQPANTVLVIVGDLTDAQVSALVNAAFPREWLTADTPVSPRSGAAVAQAPLPGPAPRGDRPLVEARVKHRHLFVAWALPGLAHPAGPAMRLLRDNLDRRLERPKGVRALDVTLYPDVGVSLLVVEAELKDDAKPDEVRDALWKLELNALFDFRGWARPSPRAWFDEQRLLERADEHALAVFATGRPRPFSEGPTPEGRAALEAFTKSGFSWGHSREVLAVPFVRTTPPPDKPTPVVALPRRPTAVDAAALAQVALGPPVSQVQRFTLENGLEVLLSRRSQVPVVGVSLGLPGRAGHADRGVAALFGYALRYDVDEHTARLYRPSIEVGADATVVHQATSSEQLPVLLELLAHNLPPQPGWFEVDAIEDVVDELQDWAEELPADEREVLAERRSLASRVMPARSSEVPVTLDELKGLSRGTVFDFIDVAYRPNGAWLVIDGDIDLEPTAQVVRALFSGWRKVAEPLPPRGDPGPVPARPKGVTVVENQDAAVTQVRFACRVPFGDTQVVGGVALLEHALEAWFEDELRRELGLTYGVHVSTTRHAFEDNLLVMSMALNPGNQQAALRRFLARLAELDGAVWEPQRVDLARWHVAKEGIGEALTSSALAYQVAADGAAGVPADEVLARPAALAKAPLRFVDDAWALCNDTFVLEVDGERSSLQKALNDAGLPPAR